eukprot:gene4360-3119_t
MFTKGNSKFANALRIKTAFPRFQEYFTLTVELKDSESESKVGKMYVGKYFTAKGDFDEESFKSDVKCHIEQFVNKDYKEVEYNHKMD